jgi:hypothetical protein
MTATTTSPVSEARGSFRKPFAIILAAIAGIAIGVRYAQHTNINRMEAINALFKETAAHVSGPVNSISFSPEATKKITSAAFQLISSPSRKTVSQDGISYRLLPDSSGGTYEETRKAGSLVCMSYPLEASRASQQVIVGNFQSCGGTFTLTLS